MNKANSSENLNDIEKTMPTLEEGYLTEFQRLLTALERSIEASPDFSLTLIDRENAVLQYKAYKCKVALVFVPSRKDAWLRVSTGARSQRSGREEIELVLSSYWSGGDWEPKGNQGSSRHKSIGSSDTVAAAIDQSAKFGPAWLLGIEELLKI